MRKRPFLLLTLLFAVFSVSAQLNTTKLVANGKVALYYKDYFLAIQYFNQVIKAKPYLAEPYKLRAFAKLYLEEFVGSEADCTTAIELNPFVSDAYACRGYARLNMRKYDEASADFEKAMELSPDRPALLAAAAYAKFSRKEYAAALADYDKLLAKNPKDNEAVFDRACLLLSMRDTVGAMQGFDRVVQNDPFSVSGRSARGRLHLEKKNYAAAIADLDEAIALGQQASDYINRALARYETNDYRGAMSDFDRALELDANDYVAYFNRGLLRAQVGDTNRAIEDFEMVLRFNPDEYAAILNLAVLEEQVGELQNAMVKYTKILEKYPYFIPAYYARAGIKRKLGMRQSAELDVQTAIDIENHKPEKKDAETEGQEDIGTYKKVVVVDAEQERRKLQYPNDDLRGNIQNKNVNIRLEENFVLSVYAPEVQNQLPAIRYSRLVSEYNKRPVVGSPLKITNKDTQLSNDLIVGHLSLINEFSKMLEDDAANADAYFLRALNYGLVQDFENAVADYNKAIFFRPDFALAYFCRANVYAKMLDFMSEEGASDAAQQARTKLYTEMLLRDYEQVFRLAPDFAYAYFDKANFLVKNNNPDDAVACYTRAIDLEPELAEAYFNRGLVRILLGQKEEGLKDLAKAGELGIYGAYNIIKRYS